MCIRKTAYKVVFVYAYIQFPLAAHIQLADWLTVFCEHNLFTKILRFSPPARLLSTHTVLHIGGFTFFLSASTAGYNTSSSLAVAVAPLVRMHRQIKIAFRAASLQKGPVEERRTLKRPAEETR